MVVARALEHVDLAARSLKESSISLTDKFIGLFKSSSAPAPSLEQAVTGLENDLEQEGEPTAATVGKFNVFVQMLTSVPGFANMFADQLARISYSVFFKLPKSAARTAMVNTLIAALRASSKGLAGALNIVLPRVQQRIRNAVERAIMEAHLGGGIPLAEHGPLSSLRLEILRLNEDHSAAFEVVHPPAASGGAASSAGGEAATHLEPLDPSRAHYKVVRKTNLCAKASLPTQMDEPCEVKHRGIIKRMTLNVQPRVGDKITAKDLTYASVEDSPTKAADDHIDAHYPRCIANCLKAHLPPLVKAHFPFKLPPTWMPPHMRDDPAKVLVLDATIDLVMRTDERGPLPDSVNPHVNKPGVPVSVAQKDNPFQFELAVRGANCMPSLGQIAVKWLTLHAHATIYWDVLDKKMSVAIRSGRSTPELTPELNWDVEVSLGGCGVPMPNWIEDWALSRLGLVVVRSFNRANLIELDLNEMKEQERVDAREEKARERRQDSKRGPKGATHA